MGQVRLASLTDCMQVSLGGNRNSLTTHYSTCRYSDDQMQGTMNVNFEHAHLKHEKC